LERDQDVTFEASFELETFKPV